MGPMMQAICSRLSTWRSPAIFAVSTLYYTQVRPETLRMYNIAWWWQGRSLHSIRGLGRAQVTSP